MHPPEHRHHAHQNETVEGDRAGPAQHPLVPGSGLRRPLRPPSKMLHRATDLHGRGRLFGVAFFSAIFVMLTVFFVRLLLFRAHHRAGLRVEKHFHDLAVPAGHPDFPPGLSILVFQFRLPHRPAEEPAAEEPAAEGEKMVLDEGPSEKLSDAAQPAHAMPPSYDGARVGFGEGDSHA